MKDLKKKIKNIYILGRYPDMDWRRVFVFFTILGFLITCWSIYLFIQVKSEPVTVNSETVGIRLLAETKEKELQKVLEKYEEKEQRFNELQAAIPPRVIPAAVATSSPETATSTETN